MPKPLNLLERATSDANLHARLVANPALGLTEDRLQALLAHPDLAEADLSLETLEQIAGGPNGSSRLAGGRQGGRGAGG